MSVVLPVEIEDFPGAAVDFWDFRQRFVLLRAQGWSYARISKEIGVSKPTLIKWGRQHTFTINNLRAADTEDLALRVFGDRQKRWEAMARQLERLEAELEKRDLEGLPTPKLHELVLRLRKEVADLSAPPQLSQTNGQIPHSEYVIGKHEWQG